MLHGVGEFLQIAAEGDPRAVVVADALVLDDARLMLAERLLDTARGRLRRLALADEEAQPELVGVLGAVEREAG